MRHCLLSFWTGLYGFNCQRPQVFAVAQVQVLESQKPGISQENLKFRSSSSCWACSYDRWQKSGRPVQEIRVLLESVGYVGCIARVSVLMWEWKRHSRLDWTSLSTTLSSKFTNLFVFFPSGSFFLCLTKCLSARHRMFLWWVARYSTHATNETHATWPIYHLRS